MKKSLVTLLTLLVFWVGSITTVLLCGYGPAHARQAKTDVQTDHLILTSPNGQYTITLRATNNGAGIWINEKGSARTIALHNAGQSGAFVGLYGQAVEGQDDSLTCDVAIAVNKAGRGGQLQFDNGQVVGAKIITVADMLKYEKTKGK